MEAFIIVATAAAVMVAAGHVLRRRAPKRSEAQELPEPAPTTAPASVPADDDGDLTVLLRRQA